MTAVRYFAGVFLVALGFCLGAANWRVFWLRHVLKRAAPSWVPVLAGGLGAVGLAVLPVSSLNGWWWAPFILDWGSAPGLVYTAAWHLARWARR